MPTLISLTRSKDIIQPGHAC